MSQEFYYVTAPIRDRESEVAGAETLMRVPMILPHELLDYISAARTQSYLCFWLCSSFIYIYMYIYVYYILGLRIIQTIFSHIISPNYKPKYRSNNWDLFIYINDKYIYTYIPKASDIFFLAR